MNQEHIDQEIARKRRKHEVATIQAAKMGAEIKLLEVEKTRVILNEKIAEYDLKIEELNADI